MNLKTDLPRSEAGRTVNLGRLFSRILLALILLSTLTTQAAFSQKAPDSPMPSWTKLAVDAPPYFYNMTDRSLAFNPANNLPCIAYGGDALYFSCWNTVTLKWDTSILDNSVGVGEYAALTYDNYARPFITYYDAYHGRLKLLFWNGSMWQMMIVPDVENKLPDGTAVLPTSQEGENAARNPTTAPAVEKPSVAQRIQEILSSWGVSLAKPSFDFESYGYGKFSSIDVDRRNGIHISYYDEDEGALEYQYYDGIEWKGKVVDDYSDQGEAGLYSSIAVDYDYNVNIAYMSEKYDDLKYARRKATGGWIVQDVDTAGKIGSFSSIALDSEYLPHIAYLNWTGGSDNLKHAVRDKNGDWHTETIDATGMTGWYASIAIDTLHTTAKKKDDRINVTYYNVTKGDLRFVRYENNRWQDPRTLDVSNPINRGLYTSVAVDGGSGVGVVYYDAGYGYLKYLYRSSKGWSKPSIVNYFSRDVGIETSLALSPNGVPFITYLDATEGNLKWARAYGNSWYKNYVLFYPRAGIYSSIDLGTDGLPRIAFYDHDYRDLMFGRWNGVWWYLGDVDRTGDVGQYAALALDATNTPHMSYYDTTNRDLLYATYSTTFSKWITTTVDFEDTQGWYSDIAVNASGLPFISYYNPSTGSLKVARESSVTRTWIPKVIDNIGLLPQYGVGAYSAIAVDKQGRPHVAYYDITNQDLKYAFWDGDWEGVGQWNISTVDAPGDVGRYASLAVNPTDGTRHICYYDRTNGDLKYARWEADGPWQIQFIDGSVADGDGVEEGDVGMYCSIDLTAAGQPAISYYDNSHGDLKLALSYPLPPMTIFLPIVRQEP